MNIINIASLPKLWWLNPWSIARQHHQAVTALEQYSDSIDLLSDIQSRVIHKQSTEVMNLREQVADLHMKLLAAQQSREHWVAKHDRAHAVAMHNERVIARLEDSITAGASIPDAVPHE